MVDQWLTSPLATGSPKQSGQSQPSPTTSCPRGILLTIVLLTHSLHAQRSASGARGGAGPLAHGPGQPHGSGPPRWVLEGSTRQITGSWWRMSHFTRAQGRQMHHMGGGEVQRDTPGNRFRQERWEFRPDGAPPGACKSTTGGPCAAEHRTAAAVVAHRSHGGGATAYGQHFWAVCQRRAALGGG